MYNNYYDKMEAIMHEDAFSASQRELLQQDKALKDSLEDKHWYLASPYTIYPLGRQEAHDAIAEYSAYLLDNGIYVFSPIVNSHYVCNHVSAKNKLSHDFWLNIDFKYIKNSRGLLVCMMNGWQDSYGIGKEIEYAKQLKLPIHYVEYMEFPKL